MALATSHRIADVQGQPVRVLREARRNARVISIDLATGLEIGESFLVASNKLANIPGYDPTVETSTSIRISARLRKQLGELAHPFETPAEVIERLIKRNAAQMQKETGA